MNTTQPDELATVTDQIHIDHRCPFVCAGACRENANSFIHDTPRFLCHPRCGCERGAGTYEGGRAAVCGICKSNASSFHACPDENRCRSCWGSDVSMRTVPLSWGVIEAATQGDLVSPPSEGLPSSAVPITGKLPPSPGPLMPQPQHYQPPAHPMHNYTVHGGQRSPQYPYPSPYFPHNPYPLAVSAGCHPLPAGHNVYHRQPGGYPSYPYYPPPRFSHRAGPEARRRKTKRSPRKDAEEEEYVEEPVATDKPKKRHCRFEAKGYCRSSNLRFLMKCEFRHFGRPAQASTFKDLPLIDYNSSDAIYFDVTDVFKRFWGPDAKKQPTITRLAKFDVPYLEQQYALRREEIKDTSHPSLEMKLYHGTNAKNLLRICHNGFALPSDFQPGKSCKLSGVLAGKSGASSLCESGCPDCSTVQHTWDRCHMYGLGAYFADDASKSDPYISDASGQKPKKHKRMLVCRVELGATFEVRQLQTKDEYHDRVLPPHGYDSIHAIGLGRTATIPSDSQGNDLAVRRNEYVIFHPFQALPLYLIEYDLP